MKKIEYTYCLNSDWHNQLAKEIGGKIIDQKIVTLPESMGKGHSFFSEVISGISVWFVDYIVSKPLKVKRLTSDDSLYVFHFIMNDYIHKVNDDEINHNTGLPLNFGFGILNKRDDNFCMLDAGQRVFELHLLIEKKLLNKFIANTANAEFTKSKIINGAYQYDFIDSNSELLLQSIKNRSIYDESFDSYLRGISLKLIGVFLNRYSNPTSAKNEMERVENKAILMTKEYLLSRLKDPFPSIFFLSNMAGMSVSKYKLLFKKLFSDTPNNYFIKQKMMLAKVLLKSGKYNSIVEVMYELSYIKSSWFMNKYQAFYNKKPSQDFVKKKDKSTREFFLE